MLGQNTLNTEIHTKSVQTQQNFIYYAGLHVSTYFRSPLGSQFLFNLYPANVEYTVSC
jgi:hypothetical protein